MRQKSMHRCPHCFAALPREYVFKACSGGTLEDGSACSGATPKAIGVGTAEAASNQYCPDHGTQLGDCCYVEDCGKMLPARWSEVSTTAIAMAGTRASGKTVYMAVTANLLVGWGRRQGMTITHYDEEAKNSFEDRFGILDVGAALYGSTEPEIPGANVRHQEPVLLRIQIPGRSDHVLILRDVAGENLQDAVMDTRHFRFLANADGIILMIDPSESAEIRKVLDGVIDLPSADFHPDTV